MNSIEQPMLIKIEGKSTKIENQIKNNTVDYSSENYGINDNLFFNDKIQENIFFKNTNNANDDKNKNRLIVQKKNSSNSNRNFKMNQNKL